MPLGILDALRGRAKMGQVTQSLRQDVQDQGVIPTVMERGRANMDKVRGRMGGQKAAVAPPTTPGQPGGLADRAAAMFPILQGPLSRVRGMKPKTQAGVKNQRIGVASQEEPEYGSVD